ncbi:MAG: 3'(2'),5'-bisphosphate nucleotidase CysQ [Brumimicrobium sp.]|nr:3'(2'),5'-bisphosphate nucleotidase CysQ [Brumimicrobium sp.]MCO5267693.1 3'(2'),5'-bisphosphate nucleotidase CysQ [Brumimicrobium sp.]
MVQNLFEKYKIAIEAALEASNEILRIYVLDFERTIKEDGSPMTSADLKSSEIIERYLNLTFIPYIGEEQEKAPYSKRKNWKQTWCFDPLDGTKEFIKKNGEFVVNIALIEDNQPIFGLIASPFFKKIILGEIGSGAYEFSYSDALKPEKWKKIPTLGTHNSPLHIISSKSHYSGNLLLLAEDLAKKQGEIRSTRMGSALKFFDLVNGRADVYPRFAPTMEWDIAAGQAIYEAVGGKIIDVMTGKSLTYNKEDLYNPYFIAYNPSVQVSLDFIQQSIIDE